MKRRKKTRAVINVLLAVFVGIAWLVMIFGNEGMLSSGGLSNLKYFTVLSNVFEGAASVVWLILNGRDVSDKGRRFAELLKYAACVCVGLTFVTVLVFLGPLYGYGNMFLHANLFFHLIIPLMAMAEFVCFNRQRVGWRENLLAAAPTLLYGTVYLVNILINGLGEPYQRDIYGFVTWGMPIGIGIFAVICAVAFLIGLALRALNRKLAGAKE